eukprot:gene12313-10594_t
MGKGALQGYTRLRQPLGPWAPGPHLTQSAPAVWACYASTAPAAPAAPADSNGIIGVIGIICLSYAIPDAT